MPEKVARISTEALREVEAALKKYVDEVIVADLSDWSKDVYSYHATNFVRWLTGEFNPGSRSAPYAVKNQSRSSQLTDKKPTGS